MLALPRRFFPPSVYCWGVVPLSAVLIALNEEKMLADALRSVAFCDEIVLVDSGSTTGHERSPSRRGRA